MAGEVFGNQRKDILGYGVWRKSGGGRGPHALGQGFAIFRIKVPSASYGAAVTIK